LMLRVSKELASIFKGSFSISPGRGISLGGREESSIAFSEPKSWRIYPVSFEGVLGSISGKDDSENGEGST
jgi:hypothetical protein